MPSLPGHKGSWGSQKPPCGAQINWGHPLAQDLYLAFGFEGDKTFFYGAGDPKSTLGGNLAGQVIGVGGLPTQQPTVFGDGLRFDAAGEYVTVTGHQASKWSRMMLATWPTGGVGDPQTDGYGLSSIAESAGSGSTDRVIGVGSGSPHATSVVIAYVYAGGAKRATADVGGVPGQPYSFFATHDGVTLSVGVNGRLAGTVSAGIAYQAYASPELTLAICHVGRAVTNIAFVAEWTRCLTAGEVAQLGADPFCFLTPP